MTVLREFQIIHFDNNHLCPATVTISRPNQANTENYINEFVSRGCLSEALFIHGSFHSASRYMTIAVGQIYLTLK